MSKYDYLIVGAGLFGSVFAQQAAEKGKRCLVIERRHWVGGNLHSEEIEGIRVQKYGPHIFHTSDQGVWDYVNRFVRFNNYLHAPVAFYNNQLYHMPYNMHTYYKLWGVRTPAEARAEIQHQIESVHIDVPKNLEERALKLMGRDLYEKLYKGYVEKQWRQDCRDLPASLLSQPKLRFTYDNRFFDDTYQGLPTEGYDVMIKRMLAGCDVMLDTNYLAFGRANADIADKTLYTGMIDEFFRFKLGALAYRTIVYENEVMDCDDYQGCAVTLYTGHRTPHTRIIEYKHFAPEDRRQLPKTVISREFPAGWRADMEPYFPLGDEKNQRMYDAYRALAVTKPDVLFGGRLGSYRFYTMGECIRAALDLAAREVK